MSFIDRMLWRKRRRVVWIGLGSMTIGIYAALLSEQQPTDAGSFWPKFPTYNQALLSIRHLPFLRGSLPGLVPETGITLPPTTSAMPGTPERRRRDSVVRGGSMNMVKDGSGLRKAMEEVEILSGPEPAFRRGRAKLVLAHNFVHHESATSQFVRTFAPAGVTREGIHRQFDAIPFLRLSSESGNAGIKKTVRKRRPDVAFDGDVDLTSPAPAQLSRPLDLPRDPGDVAPVLRKVEPDAGEAARGRRLKEDRLEREKRWRRTGLSLGTGAAISLLVFGIGLAMSGIVDAIARVTSYSKDDHRV